MVFLTLQHRGQTVREFALHESPLVLGSRADNDIIVSDCRLAERAYWIVPNGNTVLLEPLEPSSNAEESKRLAPRTLTEGDEVALTAEYSLRVAPRPGRRRSRSDTRTDPNGRRRSTGRDLGVAHESTTEPATTPLGNAPFWIGSAADNDLTLNDPKVSARHCRLEPDCFGWSLRDLGSRNGTFVNGLATERGSVVDGTEIRIGDSLLRIVTMPDSKTPAAVRPSRLKSVAMRRLHRDIERFACLKWPVLVGGESGAGKEIVARALHEQGPRKDHPFVPVNAAAIAPSLIESELFGHKKGAFSGAVMDHRGLFEQAHRGTLFLDEIAELPLALQARLLRVLEHWRVRPVGSERWHQVDVRLVCASHRDLLSLSDRGAFRHDLYYRLARLVLRVPPLRERKNEITSLAEEFLRDVAPELGPRTLCTEAKERLRSYRWPGNVRELKNVVCSAAASGGSSAIRGTDIERAIVQMGGAARDRGTDAESLAVAVKEHGGNLSAAARALGIPRSTLRDRLRHDAHAEDSGVSESLAVQSVNR